MFAFFQLKDGEEYKCRDPVQPPISPPYADFFKLNLGNVMVKMGSKTFSEDSTN